MPPRTLPPWDTHRPPPVPVRRFTVDEYHRLASAQVLTEDDRVELLEGWIVPKMTHSPRHDATIDSVHEALRGSVPESWRIRVQSAVTTADSEPEPDLAVVPGPASRYADRHPGPEDIALAVEVADSSLEDDRSVKGQLYARARIPCYWIVNLVDEQIEVHSDPSGPGRAPRYRSRHVFHPGDSVPIFLEGREVARVAVNDLLGRS